VEYSETNLGSPGLIRVGLSSIDKQHVIERYLSTYDINKVYVLYCDDFKTTFDFGGHDHEYVTYEDIIEYPYFYRLLEEIDERSLIIVDECMRTQNRSELTYNCAHHYLRLTDHKIIFEFFPIIEKKEDFLILLDFLNKDKYRGKGFDWQFLKAENIAIKHNPIILEKIDCPVTDKQRASYVKKREKLFAELGSRTDPDTIPRNLHVHVGNYKKKFLQPSMTYVARNGRFNLDNVTTYQKMEKHVLESTPPPAIIDFPHWRRHFNDFLKLSGIRVIKFLSTNLPVDTYYFNDFKTWIKRVDEFHENSKIR